jgi:hypothetical protein
MEGVPGKIMVLKSGISGPFLPPQPHGVVGVKGHVAIVYNKQNQEFVPSPILDTFITCYL